MDDIFSPFLNEELIGSMNRTSELSLNSVYQCENCTECFRSVLELREHMKSEQAKRDSEILDMDFKVRSEPYTPLSASTHVSHEEMRICNQCGKECKGYKGLKQHLAKIHSFQKYQVQCNMCDKHFKHKYALKFHIKQVHERSTRVNCHRCGKDFYNKYVLKKHDAICNKNL